MYMKTINRLSAVFIILLAFFLSASCSKKPGKPNILLVTVDTLRRDHLGAYGYPRQTSPFIDHLAKNGLMFNRVITPIPLTAGGHASILTSLHPLTHRCIKNGSRLPKSVQTIAETLRENGYYTIGTTAVYFLSGANRFDQGFDSFASPKQWKRSAEEVNKELFKQIDDSLAKQAGKPLFIWVHYYDPHSPYKDRGFEFKEKLPRRYLDGKLAKYLDDIDRYDNEIRYTDEAIKQLMNYLDSHGRSKNLVTCITADHGEQHGEHGSKGVHHDFYSETTLVPLVFHGPGIPANKSLDTPVSTMDIAGTLLYTAGLSFDYKTEGMNLLKIKDSSTTGRPFLIHGNLWRIKSLQLVRFPFSYILNFDRFYRHWYISTTEPGPANRFEKIEKEHIRVEKKKNFNQVIVELPNQLQKDFRYAAVTVNLEEKRFDKKIRVIFSKTLKTKFSIDEKTEHLTVFHPVAPTDRFELKITFSLPLDTKVKNIRYALLSEQEFGEYSHGLKKLKNDLYPNLTTGRKYWDTDELYDLTQDLAMNRNLLKNGAEHNTDADDYKKSLYRWYEFYFQKGRKLVGNLKARKLTPKQIEMLKSLGYL